jgi:hypothetical protein
MKIFAIYRNGGAIAKVQHLERMPDDPAQVVKDYNERRAAEGAVVSIEEFADDSLAAFLYNERQARKREFRNDLSDIYNLADSLIDRLRWREGVVEKMED